MIVQDYVEHDLEEKFVRDVREAISADPRLSIARMGYMLGKSPSYLTQILSGNAHVSIDLNNKWLRDVKPDLEKRAKLYNSMDKEELYQFVTTHYEQNKGKIFEKTLYSQTTITNGLKKRNRKVMLDLYDVIKGFTLYDRNTRTKEKNEAKIKQNALYQSVLNELRETGIQLTIINRIMFPEHDQLFLRLSNDANVKFSKSSIDLIKSSMPRLQHVKSVVEEYSDKVNRTNSDFTIRQAFGESMEDFAERVDKAAGWPVLHFSDGRLPKVITKSKVLTGIAVLVLSGEEIVVRASDHNNDDADQESMRAGSKA